MVARLDFVHQGKLFLQLTRRRLTLLLFMRRKLGSSSQAGGETERERERAKVCSNSSPMRESITQPCLCFPNSFWFSRKLWAKLRRTNIHQSLASLPRLTASHKPVPTTSLWVCACACACVWKYIYKKSVCLCVCVPFWQPLACWALSRNTNFSKRSLALTAALAWTLELFSQAFDEIVVCDSDS